MGMPLAGGAADKLGNGYERRFAVLAMIDILMGRADTLRVEVPGDEGAGAEFRLRKSASSFWTQTKRQRSGGTWTVSAILKENFLQDWLPKLRAGDFCTFASITSADELRQLSDGARDAIDSEEYTDEFLKSGRQAKFDAIKRAWGNIETTEAHSLLRRIDVVTVDDKLLDQIIDTSLMILVTGNLKATRRILLQYADEIIHREVDADVIWSFLQENGVHQRTQIAPATSDTNPTVRWLNDRLERLPPLVHRRMETAIAEDEASTRRLVRAITEESAPRSILEEWVQQRPSWLARSAWETQLAAAELAGAYGVGQLQADVFLELAQEGCPPRDLLIARAIFALNSEDDVAQRDQVLRGRLRSRKLEHPYARAMLAIFDSNLEDAARELDAWQPDDPADAAAKALLSLQARLGHFDNTGADPASIEEALSASHAILGEHWHSGVALWRARQLTLQALQRGSTMRFGDLREAQTLALQIREERRQWRGDSGAATAVSCEAAGIRGDLHFVLRTGLPSNMGGNATMEEFQNSDVSLQVCLAALQLRKYDIADAAAANVTSTFHQKLIEALRAESHNEATADLWLAAVASAADQIGHLAQALSGLARTGTSELPRIDEIRKLNPQLASEIEATAEINSGQYDRSIASLRTHRHQSITAAMSLAEAYRSIGQNDSAIETLVDAADDFGDPHLRLQAAITAAKSGDRTRAKTLLAPLLQNRDEDWPEFTEVLKFAAQLALDEPDLPLAVSYSKQVLRQDPSDRSARWGLIHTLMILDQASEAWDILRAAPEKLEVETRIHGQMWIDLHCKFDELATTLGGALELLAKYPDDEEVRAFILMSLMSQSSADTAVPSDLLGEYHRELESFFDRWPASPYLRRIRTEDDELLIQTLTDSLRPTPERLAEQLRLNRQFSRSEKPIVLLAEITGRTYSEVLLRRLTGLLPMSHPDQREAAICIDTVREASNRDVALDASALAVLGILDSPIRDEALAVFRRGFTTAEVARDVRQFDEDLRRHSGTLYYNPDTDSPGLTELSEQERSALREDLASMQASIEQMRCEPIRVDMPREHRRLNVHASVLHLAGSRGLTVWCDDSTARTTMRSMRIASFSTFSILEFLATRGIIDLAEMDAVLDTFVRKRINTPHLETKRIIAIAQEEDWQVASAAASLAHPLSWFDLENAHKVFNEVLLTCNRSNTSQLPGWLHAGVYGASMRATSARAAVDIGSMIFAGAMLAVVARGSLARDFVAAARAAIKAALPVDNPADVTTDPLRVGTKFMRDLLLRNREMKINRVLQIILERFDNLEAGDRLIVTEALLG
ncbi:hypothetical protein ILP97_39665 [Amycolatopsis sp. H6(2020)]|nr:hypothetical protein [Amycolatopsis sp. H6(2020)]